MKANVQVHTICIARQLFKRLPHPLNEVLSGLCVLRGVLSVERPLAVLSVLQLLLPLHGEFSERPSLVPSALLVGDHLEQPLRLLLDGEAHTRRATAAQAAARRRRAAEAVRAALRCSLRRRLSRCFLLFLVLYLEVLLLPQLAHVAHCVQSRRSRGYFRVRTK